MLHWLVVGLYCTGVTSPNSTNAREVIVVQTGMVRVTMWWPSLGDTGILISGCKLIIIIIIVIIIINNRNDQLVILELVL